MDVNQRGFLYYLDSILDSVSNVKTVEKIFL